MKNSGDKKIFYEVLDQKRIRLLEKLSEFKNDFYLAGGTALALQIGHRISMDFDFFTSNSFINKRLLKQLGVIFYNYDISIIQNEKDTLTILLDDAVKLSFFGLEYPNLFELNQTKYFNLAQVKEIGIMKLLALFRATYKDYVDMFFILKKYELSELLQSAVKKHPNFDKALYLKALISFDEVDDMPIKFIKNKEVSRKEVFNSIEKKTMEFIRNFK